MCVIEERSGDYKVFDKELFMSLCEKYNVRFTTENAQSKTDKTIKEITKEDIDKMFASVLYVEEKGDIDG